MNFPPLWDAATEARVEAYVASYHSQYPFVPPANPVMCKRCVMTSARPRITIDHEGICSACRYAERKVDWVERGRELKELFERFSYGENSYGAVVPCSGGKDSSTVAWKLKHKYNQNPLCVKWAPFVETQIGKQNLEALAQHGFDIIECMPNGLFHRKLARLSLELTGDHFGPFVYGQLAFPMQVAHRFGIPLVFGAENGEAAYGGDTSANDLPSFPVEEWDYVYSKSFSMGEMADIAQGLGVITDDEYGQYSMFYEPPGSWELEEDEGPEYHWLSYYEPHHPQGNFYHAVEHTGFQPRGERNIGTYSRYASNDDATDWAHYFMSFVKFGIGRCTSDAAHEVRDGDLDRDEALALIKQYDGEYAGRVDEQLFFDYLGLNEESFQRIIDRFNNRGLKISDLRATAY